MARQLADFLAAAMRTPFAWGVHDCLLFGADWCREQTGVDPASRFRGRYRTQIGAQRLLSKAGGLLALASAEMRHHGLQAVSEPLSGDVGVVLALTDRGPAPTGAIFDGRLWTLLGMGGLVAGPFEPLAAWRPSCPRL